MHCRGGGQIGRQEANRRAVLYLCLRPPWRSDTRGIRAPEREGNLSVRLKGREGTVSSEHLTIRKQSAEEEEAENKGKG